MLPVGPPGEFLINGFLLNKDVRFPPVFIQATNIRVAIFHLSRSGHACVRYFCDKHFYMVVSVQCPIHVGRAFHDFAVEFVFGRVGHAQLLQCR